MRTAEEASEQSPYTSCHCLDVVQFCLGDLRLLPLGQNKFGFVSILKHDVSGVFSALDCGTLGDQGLSLSKVFRETRPPAEFELVFRCSPHQERFCHNFAVHSEVDELLTTEMKSRDIAWVLKLHTFEEIVTQVVSG